MIKTFLLPIWKYLVFYLNGIDRLLIYSRSVRDFIHDYTFLRYIIHLIESNRSN